MSNHHLDLSTTRGDLFAGDSGTQAPAIENTVGSFLSAGSLSSAGGTAFSVFCFGSLSSIGSPPDPPPPPPPKPPTPPPDGGPGLF